jgi:1,4-dihydroxy-6-naphthoate synthase
MMKIQIGFSPCPNDTYIFDALVNGKIDTGELEFEVIMADVQSLNEMAMSGKIDVTKISYGTLPLLLDDYIVLDSGGALGLGVGPLLISSVPIPEPAIRQCVVAIPGRNTTAHVLFSLAYPEATNKVFLRYNEIEDFVKEGKGSLDDIRSIKVGVIIHENRFTYEQRGLVRVADLGSFWENETGLPIPLGGIVGRRSLGFDTLGRIDRLIRKSVEVAKSTNMELSPFVTGNAQEMSTEVMRKHIDLYVNEFSVELGETGRAAVRKFVQVHSAINKIPIEATKMFLTET